MDFYNSLVIAAERIATDSRNQDLLAIAKGFRNGVVYGCKVRFPHALVIIFLFRSGSLREKIGLTLSATRQHARNLGLFAVIYKSMMALLRHIHASRHAPSGKEHQLDPFIAGLVGGYFVFGRSGRSGVTQQIVIYIYARVLLAVAKVLVVPPVSGREAGLVPIMSRDIAGWRHSVADNAWPVFASVSWAAVMYLFRHHPASLQPSLRSSMQYIYADSDHWDSLKTLFWHNK